MPVFRPRMHPRRTILEMELKIGVCDVKIVGHARLKKQLTIRNALSNSMSPQDALPGRPICTNPGIEITKYVLSGHAVNCSSELRIELVLVLVRILHGWGIDTYERGVVVLGEGESD